MTMHSSEITVAVYVAILATIFAGALLALLIICGKFSCAICRINIAVNNPEKKKSFDLRYMSYSSFFSMIQSNVIEHSQQVG